MMSFLGISQMPKEWSFSQSSGNINFVYSMGDFPASDSTLAELMWDSARLSLSWPVSPMALRSVSFGQM